jgi:hypothetical protein
VTAADTLVSPPTWHFQFAPITGLPYIDIQVVTNRTAIAAVSAMLKTQSLYCKSGGSPAASRGGKNRILRNASGGYTPTGDISASSFTTIDIKDDQFFRYLFESGIVNVEPVKKKWDLAWTYFSNVTNFGAGEVPYLFQDIILLNRNVSIARVITL